MLLAFIIVQKGLDIFRETVWNTHRIRAQKDTVLPDGVPNHIYSFPQQHGLEECGNTVLKICICIKGSKMESEIK